MPDPRLKTHPPQAIGHFARAGASLAGRQIVAGSSAGHVPPWGDAAEPDFHGTLSAIWIWARHQQLSGDARFAAHRAAAWAFVEGSARRFIPDAIGSAASDEAAYDCAMVLLAHDANRGLDAGHGRRQLLADGAARLLSSYLGDVDDLEAREFRDPGFLAWALIGYARTVEDRGLLASGRRFVERAFGMKTPVAFTSEPDATLGLFDFSSTTATRVMAITAAEGATPFIGAWLRERIAPIAPAEFQSRRLDENTWNACVAWALGRAYVIATDPIFLEAYFAIMDELERRDADRDAAISRDRAVKGAETAATFYYALAADALVTVEGDKATASAPKPAHHASAARAGHDVRR